MSKLLMWRNSEVWYLLPGQVINRRSPASWERKLAAMEKEKGKEARDMGGPSLSSSRHSAWTVTVLESHSHDTGAGRPPHPVRPLTSGQAPPEPRCRGQAPARRFSPRSGPPTAPQAGLPAPRRPPSSLQDKMRG